MSATPTPKQILLAHLLELHPTNARRARITTRWTEEHLQKWHADQHWRYGSLSHRHDGLNLSAIQRPAGWKTGEDVIMLSRRP